MISRGSGRIVNISSDSALKQTSFYSVYGPSKVALTSLTNCLAGEVEKYGVSVLAYNPGYVRTPLFDWAAESEEVHKWLGYGHKERIETGNLTPMADAVGMFMFLASGKADIFSGRHFDVLDDQNDLLNREAEIRQKDLYKLRLGT